MLGREQSIAWLRAYAAAVREQKDALTQLDAAIGDADHGTNLDRGMQAAVATIASAPGQDVGAVFKAVALTLISTVGGASGPLYGTFFLRMATAAAGRAELDLAGLADAVRAGVAGVVARGKASPGDKTMVDALEPAAAALAAAAAADLPLAVGLARAAAAAEAGASATVPLVARRGRASYLGERSVGHQDPGATSAALLFRTLAASYP
jgi:dihydroxyacetone kinase-like protein